MEKCHHDSFHIGAKALIFNKEKKVLLLEREHPAKKLYWDLPGGRVHKDETVKDALVREIREEIGLKNVEAFHPFGMFLTNIRIPAQGNNVGLIFSIYTCHLLTAFHPILSKEHINFEWLTLLQAAEKLKLQYPEELIEKLAEMDHKNEYL